MVSWSTLQADDKQRQRGKKARGKDSCSVNGIGTLTWPSAAKKIYGSLGFVLRVPITFLSFWSAVIKFWHKETFELDPRTIIFATSSLKPELLLFLSRTLFVIF